MCNFLSAVLKRDTNTNNISLFLSKSGSDSHSVIIKECQDEFLNLDDYNFASIEILDDELVLDSATKPAWARDYLRANAEQLFSIRLSLLRKHKEEEKRMKKL